MKKLWQQLAIATNWPVLAALMVLTAMGLISIWFDSPEAGKKQLQYLVVAFFCMTLFQAVDYRSIGRWAWPFYFFGLALILYTIVGQSVSVPFVRPVKGAYNWINFGRASLQPAELMKVGFVLVMARYLRFRSNYRTFLGLLAPFALALIPIAMILKQPDLGTALVFIPCLFVMLYVAGAKMKHLLFIIALGVGAVPFIWLSGAPGVPVFEHFPQLVRDYQRARVYSMFSTDPRTLSATGYQQEQAMTAYGSGGITGKGPGQIPIGQHVPEAHNDMVYALIGEQFGFFGSLIVLSAYIVLFSAGIEIAAATREPFGRLVAIGIVAILAGQTFINIMVATKLMPVTGITLPFVSYGGSSLLASYMAVGLLLNVGQNRPLVMARDSFEYE